MGTGASSAMSSIHWSTGLARSSIEAISDLYATTVAESNLVIEAQGTHAVTSTDSNKDRSLRWVMVNMIDETASHVGRWTSSVNSSTDGPVVFRSGNH